MRKDLLKKNDEKDFNSLNKFLFKKAGTKAKDLDGVALRVCFPF